eukprot:COSAG06_NODE_4798_length_3945_cov_19.107644_3_plen_77_part_00
MAGQAGLSTVCASCGLPTLDHYTTDKAFVPADHPREVVRYVLYYVRAMYSTKKLTPKANGGTSASTSTHRVAREQR